MAVNQRIMAMIQAGELDVIVTGANVFPYYADSEFFTDLRTLFSPEELAFYQDYLYYIDAAAIAAAQAQPTDVSAAETVLTDEQKAAIFESRLHPENMKTPIPVGILMNDSAYIKATESYPADPPVFGITVTTKRPENARAYLEYLWTTAGP
jgi:hypothetical protein